MVGGDEDIDGWVVDVGWHDAESGGGRDGQRLAMASAMAMAALDGKMDPVDTAFSSKRTINEGVS